MGAYEGAGVTVVSKGVNIPAGSADPFGSGSEASFPTGTTLLTPEDLVALAEYFLLRYAASYRRPARRLTRAAIDAVRAYGWPGNIRELQNVIERAVILSSGPDVDLDVLSIPQATPQHMRPRIGDALSLEDLECAHIRGVMATSPSLESAARTLGIDVSTLYRKRKQYGL